MNDTDKKRTHMTHNIQLQRNNPEYVPRNNTQLQARRLNPIWRMILQGIYGDSSPLANLRGIPHVVQIIWNYLEKYWMLHILIGKPEEIRRFDPHHGQFAVILDKRMPMYFSQRREITLEDQGKLTFPEPSGININMMPFIMASSFDQCFLPEYLKHYFDNLIDNGILKRKTGIMRAEMGKVCYLSVQESWIEENTSQRRPGLHTESPGKLTLTGQTNKAFDEDALSDENKGKSIGIEEIQRLSTLGGGSTDRFKGIHRWGKSLGYLQGGIYMASTVKNSCKLWDCQILTDEEEEGDIIGKLGDIEHLRKFLPEGQVMENNSMYWMTDRTPHESLPLDTRTYRQWFRLVTSGVSLWFQDHSTKNPLGIVPDPNITKIVKGSKFSENSLTLLNQNV